MGKTKARCFELRLPNGDTIAVNKEKLLVGSSQKCDVRIQEESVSSYHAMIFADEEGLVTVLDLDSLNGVFVAGNRIDSRSFIGEGDTVTFGNAHLDLIPSLSEEVFQREDQAVSTVKDEEKIYVPKRENENQAFIDGEYCDIVFNEENFSPLNYSPVGKIAFAEYIDNEEIEDPFNIAKDSEETCLIITTLVSGNILEQNYLPLKEGEYLASGSHNGGKRVFIDVLEKDQELEFIQISNGKVSVSAPEGFDVSAATELAFNSSEVVVLTRSTFQIFIEIGNAPAELIRLPLLAREKEFWKQAGKIFAGVMLPMLLLLLVDFTVEKKKDPKKLSIIYKKPTNTEMNNKAHASKDASKTDKNNGHKKTEQNKKKVARSKAGEKKVMPKKAQKVAKAPAKSSKKTAKSKAPVKAYEFKLASNIDSMMADGKTAKVAATRSPASSAPSALSGSLDTKVNGTTSAKVGNMGSDLAGASKSFGAKGLSGKKGMDTSFIETETVVLGSMDPELLRKILQQYLPQFRHCYQQELAYNSEDIQGIVDLNFEISGVGKVGKIDIKAKDSRFSSKGIDCMTRVLSIIDFPKPKGGGRVAVRQPLNFFSEKERS